MSQQHDDDEGTVIRPAGRASTAVLSSGAASEAGAPDGAEDSLSLRIGARVAEFEVLQRIGEGGFSIVYLARDHSLERTVALKEYLPSSLATRVGATQVQPRSQRYRDTFEAGLKSFVNEARLLAQFDHPSLVKVYRFWEANGTAYMVMPFYQGITMKEAVRAMPRPPDEAWLVALLRPLMEALAAIHAEHCYHRDIAPDNVILLSGSGKPLLLDFGAARRVIGDTTQGLTVILKAGYAPVEQYAEIPGMKQGPWTDVYALAAVVYWAITGSTPPPSVGRTMSDSFVPLAQSAAGRYSPRFLQAIDHALIVLPEQRTQTIDALRQDLGLADAASAAPTTTRSDDADMTVIRPAAYRSGPATVTHHPSPGTEVPAHAGERKGRARRWVFVASAAGAAAAAAGLWWGLQGPGVAPIRSEADAASGVAPQAAPPAATQGIAEAPGPAPAGTSAPPPTAEAAPTGQTPPTVQVPPAVQTPTTVQTPPTVQTPMAAPPTTETPPSPETTTPAPAVAAEAAKPPPAASPPPPVEPVGEAPAPRAAKAPAPPKPAAAPIEQATDQPAQRPDAGRRERVRETSPNRAECARILQRLSLGESSPELVERLKALNCH